MKYINLQKNNLKNNMLFKLKCWPRKWVRKRNDLMLKKLVAPNNMPEETKRSLKFIENLP